MSGQDGRWGRWARQRGARATKILWAAVLAGALLAPAVARAACKKGQVFVKAQTAVRRGPGLNFAPSTLLDDGRCYAYEEVSADQAWVLIKGERGDPYGWVSVSAIDAEGRAALGKGTQKGAVGSETEPRGFVVTRGRSTMFVAPDRRATVKKVIPPGARILGLALTEDGKWLEIRDDRGETGWITARGVNDDADVLTTLPRKEVEIRASDLAPKVPEGDFEEREESGTKRKKFSAKKPAKSAKGVIKDEAEDGDGDSADEAPEEMTFEVAGALLLALPQRGLASNGVDGIRRYTLRAAAVGAHLEGLASGLGPVRGRATYDFVFLNGLALAGVDGALSAQSHDGRLLAGYPLDLGWGIAVPEVGYAFSLFSMPAEPPGGGGPQFVSTVIHALHLGSTAEYSYSEDLRFDGELGLSLGTTQAGGVDLGGPKLALGVRLGLSGRYALGSGLSVLARYELLYQRSPFAGMSATDPTITEATVTQVGNAFGVGLAYEL